MIKFEGYRVQLVEEIRSRFIFSNKTYNCIDITSEPIGTIVLNDQNKSYLFSFYFTLG